jgi:transcriptional regulator with XRE-family HTH domain
VSHLPAISAARFGSCDFHLLRQQTRVTYWPAPGRRVILLTVFRKTRGAETAEVARALRAQGICQSGHSRAHEIFNWERPEMTTEHSGYEDLARERRSSSEYRQGYAEAQRAFLIGQAVRERRAALGLSQVELAARAGMTQPALSRLEAGGVVPTIPLLERISIALDADLIVKIAPHAASSALSSTGGPDGADFTGPVARRQMARPRNDRRYCSGHHGACRWGLTTPCRG